MEKNTQAAPGAHRRTAALLGEKGMQKLARASVAVVGLGGVGGSAFEALLRTGVGTLTVCDGDVFERSNLNRQILSSLAVMGKNKALAAKAHAKSISPKTRVSAKDVFLDEENITSLLEGCACILDCVDDVRAKVLMAEYSRQSGAYLISAMGTGARTDMTKLKIADIFETHHCALARRMRSELKKRGIAHLQCVFSEQSAPVIHGDIPSAYFVPNAAGMLMAGEVIKKIIEA